MIFHKLSFRIHFFVVVHIVTAGDMGLVEDRQHLLADALRDRIKARARTSGENYTFHKLIPIKNISCIDFILYVFEDIIVSVRYYCIGLDLEGIEIIDHLAAEEC